MTPTQKLVLAFVASHIDRHGSSPSLEEIAIGLGRASTSKGNICARVGQLVKRGLLCRLPGSHVRNLQVTELGRARLGRAANDVGPIAPVAPVDLSAVPTRALVAELGRRAHG